MITTPQQPIGPFGPYAGNQDEDEMTRQLKMAMLAAQNQQDQQMQSSSPAPMPDSAQSAPAVSAFQSAPTPKPDVNLAHASYADQPAASDVAQAQGNLDHFQHKPMWQKMILPAVVGGISALGARTRNGAQMQQNTQADIQQYGQRQVGERESLIKQLEFAKSQQQSQYEADQRNRQQDILAAGNNQTRSLMAQIAAGSRERVADTRADASRDVANTNVQGRKDVAGIQGQTARDVAQTKGGFDIDKAQINATAALNRFLAGQARTDARQQAGFSHADNKPTSDEDRRADLSHAVSGYADMLIDIATRRPELLGPVAGRITNLRNTVGTSDPDVAKLKMINEQLGLTQIGAHSMRSAQAVERAAAAIMNNLHNSPEATIQAAREAQDGVQQFMKPQVRPEVISPQSPAPARTPLKSKVTGQSATPPRPKGVPADAQYDPKGNGGKGMWYK